MLKAFIVKCHFSARIIFFNSITFIKIRIHSKTHSRMLFDPSLAFQSSVFHSMLLKNLLFHYSKKTIEKKNNSSMCMFKIFLFLKKFPNKWMKSQDVCDAASLSYFCCHTQSYVLWMTFEWHFFDYLAKIFQEKPANFNGGVRSDGIKPP